MEDRSLVDDGGDDGDTVDGKVGACTLVRKRLAVLDSIVGDSGVACFLYVLKYCLDCCVVSFLVFFFFLISVNLK